jgi:hypothetical protein
MSHRDEPVNGCAAIYQIDHGCSDGVCGEPCEFKPAAPATDRPAVNVGASRPYPQFARRRGIRGEFDLGAEVSHQARPAAVKATTGGPARKSGGSAGVNGSTRRCAFRANAMRPAGKSETSANRRRISAGVRLTLRVMEQPSGKVSHISAWDTGNPVRLCRTGDVTGVRSGSRAARPQCRASRYRRVKRSRIDPQQQTEPCLLAPVRWSHGVSASTPDHATKRAFSQSTRIGQHTSVRSSEGSDLSTLDTM